MSERDEQVKRLAETIRKDDALLTHTATELAGRLYDAGARIPDPPAPTLPVVSDYAEEQYVARIRSLGYPCNYEHEFHGVVEARKAGLRAAFPIILRESLDALPKDHLGDVQIGGGWRFGQHIIDRLYEALTGEAR